MLRLASGRQRRGVVLRAVNADDLLNQLVAHGIAEEAAAPDLIRRRVRFGEVEVAIAEQHSERNLRARWKQRVGNTALWYLLIVDHPDRPGSVRVLGPRPDQPVRSVDCARLAHSIEEASKKTPGRVVRQLESEIIRLAGRGKLVHGLLTNHTLEHRLRGNEQEWQQATRLVEAAHAKAGSRWQQFLAGLGYEVERLEPRGFLLRHEGKPVAVAHPKANADMFIRFDDTGRPVEGVLAGDCRRHNARYGMFIADQRYRLFDCDPSATTSHWLDLDASLLAPEDRGYLALLGPKYLAEGGLTALQADARAFGADLRRRLDQTIRQEALPVLAEGLSQWATGNLDISDDHQRDELEQAALTLLFRVLFILYAESSGFLPVQDDTYRRHSLTDRVAEAHHTQAKLSPESHSLWGDFKTLVEAMRSGNPAWGVPAYNGALFAKDDFAGAELLERIQLADPYFGRLLVALGHNSQTGHGIDFSTLEIGHLGHIYESLLSLKLSVANQALRYDAKNDRYVALSADARTATESGSNGTGEVAAGALLWQTNEGGRKAGGVYYTPAELVRHIVKHTVLPAFDRHLDRVSEIAESDPHKAAGVLLEFSVLDPACGSAHFLVQVTEALADRTVAFLAERPLPLILQRINELRDACSQSESISDIALLRRLILKHCVFGVDVSQMGAEVATLSLWLASFVPGLSLAYLDRNVVVGNSLLGVADAEVVIPQGTLMADQLETAMGEAAGIVARLAEIDDLTPAQVKASKAADQEACEATMGLRRLFDLWTAEGFGLKGARDHAQTHGADVITGSSGDNIVAAAEELGSEHGFLHWPLQFPGMFFRSNPGFDVVVGNPPWEEITVEELSHYGRYLPGAQGLPAAERDRAVTQLLTDRPELEAEFEWQQHRAALQRGALKAGEYESTKGDPDLYKYFCQRYGVLVRPGGAIGVVLPGAAFVNQGSEAFRRWLYSHMTARRVDFLLNNRRWMFETHPQYGVAVVQAERVEPEDGHRVVLAGVADSPRAWQEQSSSAGVLVASAPFRKGAITPKLRSQAEADLLAKLRVGSRFPLGSNGRWNCFPVRELDETNDKRLWHGATTGRPLWKGESFDQYNPHGAEARLCPESTAVWKKVRKPRPGAGSILAKTTPLTRRKDAVLNELERARIAYRAIARATDGKTIIASRAPPEVLLANSAPYLAFTKGAEDARSVCLGVMNSLIFDWQARRFVEANLNVFILESLIVPDLDDRDFDAVARAAARLSAVDDRFTDFAAATGVECGPLSDEERQRLRVEIDARVARAWSLTMADLETIFLDFTTDAVPVAYRQALIARFEELL